MFMYTSGNLEDTSSHYQENPAGQQTSLLKLGDYPSPRTERDCEDVNLHQPSGSQPKYLQMPRTTE